MEMDRESAIAADGRTAGRRRGRGAYLAAKRAFDIAASALGLAALSPVLLVTALAVRLEDGGEAIYRQERTGLHGRTFVMYKFRSMRPGAEAMRAGLLPENEAGGPAFKMRGDPRVTRVGRFIRRTSIDELPQLVNILKGDMSVVGPRPLPTYEAEQLTPYENRRLEMKPGLTCYWQVGGRSDVPFAEWMEMDRRYIEEAGIVTDLKIILKTFGVVLSGKGAC